MDLLVAWVLFPIVLTGLCAGCGALVGTVAGRRLPLALLPGIGFAAAVVVGQFLTLADATAELTTPVLALLALAGLVLLSRRVTRWPSGWAALAALAVFAVYAAPVVLSGEATFAGYIRLDDTATWMALTDRVMEHGRSLEGLAPSTYEATLAFNLADGYPVGVFIPLGAAGELVGEDVAWLIQPYLAWLGACLALALWALGRALIASPAARSAAAFVAAQPALLFGYYLWGGIKEMAAAALIATLAAAIAYSIDERLSLRSLLAPALLAAALLGVLSAGGAAWLVPVLIPALLAGARRLAPRPAALRMAGLAAATALLALPVLVTGGLLPPTSSPLTDADASGNLIGPVEPAQAAGIWPAGDFRLAPDAELLTYALIAATILAAAAGVALAWRNRAWGPLSYVGGTAVAAALIWSLGSPWVDGKALATASPALPFAAALFGCWLLSAARAAAGVAILALLAGGVLWSNALAYREVNLAPRAQLAELERIGERIAGEGPTLMTEYQPYGARHFLREADPEAVSELRRRRIPLLSGEVVPKGETADTDALDPPSLLSYRTLVLRRSPLQSRPPAAYELTSAGEFYEVWQRPVDVPAVLERLALGTGGQTTAVPRCEDVRALAAGSAPGATLIAARRPAPIEVPLAGAGMPADWRIPGSPGNPQPRGAGVLEADVRITRGADYEVWLGGSIRSQVELLVDGRPVATARHQLNNEGQFVSLGEAHLDAGDHRIELSFGGADLHPGSGGAAPSIGPLVLASGSPAQARLQQVPAARASALCGRPWDWIELGG